MKKTEITSFLQGYANAGNTSEYAVKTPVYRGICTDKVTIDIVDENIQFALVGYSDPTTKNLVFELKWYTEKQKIFNLSSYSKGIYWVVVLTNKDGTEISPADVSSVTITIENLWYIDANGDLLCDGMPYAPEKNMSEPYPASLWRVDSLSPNMPYHRLFPLISPIHTKAVPQHDYIIIYDKNTSQDDFNNNGMAVLEPISCTVTENFNADWTVTLEHPIDRDQKWKLIKEFNIIKVLDQLFTIKKVEHLWSGNSGKVVAYAEHIFYQLNDRWIFKGADIYAESGYWLIRSIINHADTKYQSGHIIYNFNYYSDITSETVGFDMPLIAYYKWNPLRSSMTPLEMLLGSDGFTANFGGDLYRDNFYFSLNKHMENHLENSFDIHVGLNLMGIRRTVDTSSLCTHYTAFDKFGSGVSVYWDVNGGISHHIVRSQEYDFGENYEESDMDLIGHEAEKYFGQHMEPQIDISVDLEDVRNNPDYEEFSNNPRYKVGDRGRIYDERLGISVDAHITRTVKDGITGKNLEITFSNVTGFANFGDYDISFEQITKPELPENPEEI